MFGIKTCPQAYQPDFRIHLSDAANRSSEAPLALRLPSTSLRRQRADSGEPRGRLRLPGVGGGGGGRAAEDAVPGRQRLRDFERVLLVSGLDT